MDAGKEVRAESFPIIELKTPEQFRTILSLFSSVYEGHDEEWVYVSSSLSSQDPNRVEEGPPYEMVYKIKKKRLTYEWLKKVCGEKKKLLEEQLKTHTGKQFPIIQNYQDWLQKTKPVVTDEW